MKKVTIALPSRIGKGEAQDIVVCDLRARALLKLKFYRRTVKPCEARYATTFPRLQRRVEKAPKEDFAAWDDLIKWEAYYRGYQEWKNATLSRTNGRHAEVDALRERKYSPLQKRIVVICADKLTAK